MRARYVLTVLAEIASSLAICETVRPLPSRRMTSNSRSDRSSWGLAAPPDLQAELDKAKSPGLDTGRDVRRLIRGFELRERLFTEARARDSAATPAERERIVRTYADSLLGSQPFLPMLGRLFGLWDLLWLGLGASSAWKLAQIGTG